ncbi:unnamed protein product [Leptosia nina]|uniref:Uncharacterized protein n=1 Tax=Leptosia nina TaxID=320188 RepID=A0AAV1JR18_9NEOP
MKVVSVCGVLQSGRDEAVSQVARSVPSTRYTYTLKEFQLLRPVYEPARTAPAAASRTLRLRPRLEAVDVRNERCDDRHFQETTA